MEEAGKELRQCNYEMLMFMLVVGKVWQVEEMLGEMFVGKVSVKHSCEDELALTVAFVLTHHTPYTHIKM